MRRVVLGMDFATFWIGLLWEHILGRVVGGDLW